MASLTQAHRHDDRENWWNIHDKSSYLCPDCGRTQAEHGKAWQVHHIKRQPGKIVALCTPCHKIRHGADVKDVDLGAWKAAFLRNDPSEHREDRSKERHSVEHYNQQSNQ